MNKRIVHERVFYYYLLFFIGKHEAVVEPSLFYIYTTIYTADSKLVRPAPFLVFFSSAVVILLWIHTSLNSVNPAARPYKSFRQRNSRILKYIVSLVDKSMAGSGSGFYTVSWYLFSMSCPSNV